MAHTSGIQVHLDGMAHSSTNRYPSGFHSAMVDGTGGLPAVMKDIKNEICLEIETIVKQELYMTSEGLKTWFKEFFRSCDQLPSETSSHRSQSKFSPDACQISLMHRSSKKVPAVIGDCEGLESKDSLKSATNQSLKSATNLLSEKSDKDNLFYAVCCNQLDDVRRLLENGDNVNKVLDSYTPFNSSKTFNSCSVLTVAVMSNYMDMVRLLVARKAQLESTFSLTVGENPVTWSGSVIFAAQDLPMLKELVRLRANPHEVSSDNGNLISQCCQRKDRDMVNYLLSCGVDYNTAAVSLEKTKVSYSPLHLATRAGDLGIVNLLLQAQAEITENEMGISPLHEAIHAWYSDITFSLIAHGAPLVDSRESRTISGRLEKARNITFHGTLELLFDTANPLVWEAAARGLKFQELQVRTLTPKDVLHFLKLPGQSRLEILDSIFCKRDLRYRNAALDEMVVRSAFVPVRNTESFVNAAATSYTYDDLEAKFEGSEPPDETMRRFLDRLVPTRGRECKIFGCVSGTGWLPAASHVKKPVSVYESLIPDFHHDLQVLKTIADCQDHRFFETRACQALLWHAYKTTKAITMFDAAILFQQLLVYLLIAIDTHHLCKGSAWCFGVEVRLTAAIGLALWLVNCFEETMSFLAHVAEGWFTYYLQGWCRSKFMSPTYVRITNNLTMGVVLGYLLINDDSEDLADNQLFRIVFGLSCLSKWWEIMLFLQVIRPIGRPLMPIICSFQELVPLLLVCMSACGAFVHFWIALDVPGEDGFEDRLYEALYFGMTADFEAVGSFREPTRNKFFMHFVLVLATLFAPVIMMNCTIAAMSTSYARAASHSEALYQRSLARIVFLKATFLKMMNSRFGVRIRWLDSPSYLWYACELPSNRTRREQNNDNFY